MTKRCLHKINDSLCWYVLRVHVPILKADSYVGTLGGPMFLHYNYRQVHPKEIPARNLIPILDFGEEILSPVF